MSVNLVVLNALSEPVAEGRESRMTEGGAERPEQPPGMEPGVTQRISRVVARGGDQAPPGNFALDFPKLVLHG